MNSYFNRFGIVHSNFSMDDVRCLGNESSILDCSYNRTHNCGGGEGAGVVCTNDAHTGVISIIYLWN